jgi:signal transduction histidine kinase
VAVPDAFTRARAAVGPRGADAALAVALALFAQLEVWVADAYRGARPGNAAFLLVMALALAWRRRAPLLVLAIVMAGLTAQSATLGGSETGSLLLIAGLAVYSAAAHGARPIVGAAIALVGAVGHGLWDPEIDSVVEGLYSPLVFGLVFLFGLAMRVRQSRTAAVEARARALEEEHRRAREGAAEERRRIAHELHDIVAHSLGVMVLQAGAAEQVLDTSPGQAREALRLIRETGQEAVEEMARLLGLIRDERQPALEPQPSLANVDALVGRARAAGLEVELTIEGDRRPLPAALELSAFRIVQEGLTNVLKHARARSARVVVCYRDRVLELEVADEGGGASDGGGGGHGLAGLRERVSVFGGRLEAGRRPDGGWTLRAVLPVER